MSVETDDALTVDKHRTEVTICKSGGTDGATVIYVDTHPDDALDDGTPAIRVYVNDDPVFVGVPRSDDDDEEEAA